MQNQLRIFVIIILTMALSSATYSIESDSSRGNPYPKSFLNGMGFSVPLLAQKGMEGHDHSMHMNHGGHGDGHGHNMMTKAGSPIGFMGGHGHKANHLMFRYTYMYMSMKGDLMRGDNSISLSEATEYMMLPTEMTMEMHMFGLMYSIIDDLVVMAMIPYVVKEMTMEQRNKAMAGADYITQSSDGFGDLKIGAGYTFLRFGNHYLHLDLLLGIPTGSISKTNYDSSTSTYGQHLGYPMQIGSGSFELLPALTYSGFAGSFTWAAKVGAAFRLNKNSSEYTLGNRYEGDIWGAWRFIRWVSFSLRFKLDIQENISGQDIYQPTNTAMMPGHDPQAYGFARLNGLAGLNFYLPKLGPIMSRIGVEGGIPLYQYNHGVKRGTDWMLSAGLRMGIGF